METNRNEKRKYGPVSLGYGSRAAGCEETEICGDTAFSCRLPDGSRAVILSDGMGHGPAAASESRAAAGMLRRLLKRGMPAGKAIREVNRKLLRNGRGRESFATVDLTIIDKTGSRARFYKMGAAPTYFIRGRRIRKITRPALPVGILPEIRLSHVSLRLYEGDIIIMMSDGISDSGRRDNEGGDWVTSFLYDMMGEKGLDAGPRQIARILLEEAERRYESAEGDDTTAAVMMIR